MAPAITTAEQLLKAQHLGRCELLAGELRQLIPPGDEHGRIAADLVYELKRHVKPRDLGVVHGEVGYVIARDPDTVRAPDVAFTSAKNAAPRSPKYCEGTPDIVIEILSPDDRPGYVRDKVEMWLEAGATLVWEVDPAARTVTVHQRAHGSHTLHEADTLTGGPVLPDFALPLGELFA